MNQKLESDNCGVLIGEMGFFGSVSEAKRMIRTKLRRRCDLTRIVDVIFVLTQFSQDAQVVVRFRQHLL